MRKFHLLLSLLLPALGTAQTVQVTDNLSTLTNAAATIAGSLTAGTRTFSDAGTTQQLNNDLWVGSSTGQYSSIANCYAALSPGQACHIPANWTDPTWTQNLVWNKNDACLIFHGSATIPMSKFSITKSSSVQAGCIMGYSGNIPLFIYTGDGNAFQIGDTSANSEFYIHFVRVDISGAGSSAVGMYFTRLGSFSFYRDQVNCAGGATSQVGFVYDGTGNFTGIGVTIYPATFGCVSGIRLTGNGGYAANSNTIIGGTLNSAGVTNSNVLDFQDGNGNTVINVDIEGAPGNAVNFAATSLVFGNTVSIYGGGNATDVAFGAGSTGNSFELGGGTTGPPVVSGTVPPNVVKWRGTLVPAAVDFGTQSANIRATKIIDVAGKFRVDCYVSVTRRATTSSTLPQVNIIYNDLDNGYNTVVLPCTGNSPTASLGTTGTHGNNIQTANSGTVIVNSGNLIQYSTSGYASVGAKSMQYKGHIRLTYIGP